MMSCERWLEQPSKNYYEYEAGQLASIYIVTVGLATFVNEYVTLLSLFLTTRSTKSSLYGVSLLSFYFLEALSERAGG